MIDVLLIVGEVVGCFVGILALVAVIGKIAEKSSRY